MKGAIQQCATAGIRVIVITGDNQLTANAICLDIGIFEKAGDATKRSFTGREFASMTLPKQIAMLTQPGGCVCSRAEPKHKQDIVRLLKEQGTCCLSKILAHCFTEAGDCLSIHLPIHD